MTGIKRTRRGVVVSFDEVEASFGDMAAVVARTLGDVSERLGVLDEVLRELGNARAAGR